MNEYLQALILGVLEGLTEFLPVSSTGHLILASSWLGFNAEGNASFKIFIQLGAVLAVVLLFRHRFFSLLDFKSSSALAGKAGIIRLVVGCLPAAVVGALCHSTIKRVFLEEATALNAALFVAAALLIGGIVLILIERFRPASQVSIEELSVKQAFQIGLFQVLALWPGMSRSGSTIVGGMLLGLSRKDAAEFSFLLAAPIMFGAVTLDIVKDFSTLQSIDPVTFAIGFVTAFISGGLAMKGLIQYISSHSLAVFGWYRILLAAFVLWLSV